jgi:hypothetical protein
MRKITAFLFVAGFAMLAVSTRPVLAIVSSSKLVYKFTYSSQQQITARDSSTNAEQISTGAGGPELTGGTNGMSHYQGSLTDKGTITVDILRQQTDGGLVVDISEQGESVRRAPPATCVVYGNTNVICDPNKTVYTEEYTLLRFLGTNFVDPSQLDANKHWSIVQNGSSETVSADYSINSNNGGNMQIGEKRQIKEIGAGHLTSDVQTKIGYDFSRAIPTSVDEYVTQHVDSGLKGTSTNIYQTTLSLASSSSAAAAAGP